MPPTKMFHLIEMAVKGRPRSSKGVHQNHAHCEHTGQSQDTEERREGMTWVFEGGRMIILFSQLAKGSTRHCSVCLGTCTHLKCAHWAGRHAHMKTHVQTGAAVTHAGGLTHVGTRHTLTCLWAPVDVGTFFPPQHHPFLLMNITLLSHIWKDKQPPHSFCFCFSSSF